MDQYRLSSSNRLNQSAIASEPQKLTFWQRLYKQITRVLSYFSSRGRQLLWIGSTGFIIIMWPFIYLSLLENSGKPLSAEGWA